ncbi:hypothetical protein HYH03_014527 [Edaphochlamys debaryana]|uniref:Uncharacterized protein n=1 Tax=Edaphochlamys debaryana TaxID=47281 RepID=A0A835XW08_9CHLO|nr:hypothetical protein HYH03_014527 [Edaphochlamys debaryana]|eukprot:KAG2486844.1 hypothetical protein HYH03_014527 [Edaphochlamys debaryana]
MRSTYVKVPWAEPEDLASTFREDLADMVAQHWGDRRRLAHVYVRRGCIELRLFWEAQPGEEACEEALLSDEELLSALRLTPPYGSKPLTVRQCPLLGDADDAATAPQQLRVEDLRPRVLLLPQTPSAVQPAPSTSPVCSDAREVVGVGWPLRLRARVAFSAPPGSAPDARALALSGGRFLATRVVSRTLYDSGAVYDIELPEPRRGQGLCCWSWSSVYGGVQARAAFPAQLRPPSRPGRGVRGAGPAAGLKGVLPCVGRGSGTYGGGGGPPARGNLARGLHEDQALLSLTDLPVFAAFLVAALLAPALAWPFLPQHTWVRPALRSRRPSPLRSRRPSPLRSRRPSPLVSKAVFAALRVPARATAAGYVGCVGMLLLGGVLHPATGLVTPLEAAVVAAAGVRVCVCFTMIKGHEAGRKWPANDKGFLGWAFVGVSP